MQVLARLVEEVDLVALLALRNIEAVGDKDADGGNGEQPDLPRVLPHEADADQRETRVHDRCRLGEPKGRRDAGAVDASLGERYRGEDHQRLEHTAGEDRPQDAEEAHRAQRVVMVDEVHEEHRHDAVGYGEIGEVEGQLQR